MRARRQAFTLLEVLLVMAILVIMLSLALPSIEGMYSDVRATAAVDQVRSVWAEARAHSIEEGQPYLFAVVPGEAGFKLAPDRPEFWEGADAPPGEATDVTPYVVEDSLPKKVVFTLTDGSASAPVGGNYVRVATFLPDGTCGEDSEIRIDAAGARPVLIRLRALTGAVSTQKLPASEAR